MRPNESSGSTDTISTIPLIGCCVFSAMVLIASLSYSLDGSRDYSKRSLSQEGEDIFDVILRNLAEIGQNGIRYLRNDWRDLIDKDILTVNNSNHLALQLSVRIMGEEDIVRKISGNIDHCGMTMEFSEPALMVKSNAKVPADLRLVVGI